MRNAHDMSPGPARQLLGLTSALLALQVLNLAVLDDLRTDPLAGVLETFTKPQHLSSIAAVLFAVVLVALRHRAAARVAVVVAWIEIVTFTFFHGIPVEIGPSKPYWGDGSGDALQWVGFLSILACSAAIVIVAGRLLGRMTTQPSSSPPQLVRTDRGPFGLPRGLPGRVAGRLMASNAEQHLELVQLVELPRQGSLCEVGFGPGVLLGLIRSRFPDANLCGADPSTIMLHQASRANAGDGMDLRLAAAADLPFDDHSFDVTVSVNTVQFWPDLAAGLREIHRVTRPGGTVLLAWHGGSRPTRIQRRLTLDDSELSRIASAMNQHVGHTDRHRLAHSELFSAAVRQR